MRAASAVLEIMTNLKFPPVFKTHLHTKDTLSFREVTYPAGNFNWIKNIQNSQATNFTKPQFYNTHKQF